MTPEQKREIIARARRATFAKAEHESAHATDNAGLVYRRRDNSLVAAANPKVARTEADDGNPSANVSVYAASETTEEQPWWRWVQRHCDDRMDVMSEAVAQALGWTRAEIRAESEREVGVVKRELDLMRRELAALREQVGLERGLRALRDEVAEARAEVPKLPGVTTRLEAEQVRLRSELDAAKRKLQANQLVTDHSLSKLRKQTAAATRAAASVEVKLETSSSFVMQTIHPAAAKELQEFALRNLPAGTA